MNKGNKTIHVQGKNIGVMRVGTEDYICLTDMVRGEEGTDHIKNWMRSRNTVEFIGLWETIHNPDFKGVEFDTFRKYAGLNSFTLTPQKWIENTNATGFVSKPGRKGGTYAHEDIAFEFAVWLSPSFKLFLIKEFKRLKQQESAKDNARFEWNARRLLAKVGYELQTDAIKRNIIPMTTLPPGKHGIVYADEAEVLNKALFGVTSKEWRDANPEKHLAGLNMRDQANIAQLIVLNNIEAMNADMIEQGLPQVERLNLLRNSVVRQLEVLVNDYRIQRLESGGAQYVEELIEAEQRRFA